MSSPEGMMPHVSPAIIPVCLTSASKGMGAGLPLLLASAPPGDGVKAAGPTSDYWWARGAQLELWTPLDLSWELGTRMSSLFLNDGQGAVYF